MILTTLHNAVNKLLLENVSIAKPARHLLMQVQVFLCLKTVKESISKEVNNDNDLNLHSMTKLSG